MFPYFPIFHKYIPPKKVGKTAKRPIFFAIVSPSSRMPLVENMHQLLLNAAKNRGPEAGPLRKNPWILMDILWINIDTSCFCMFQT